MNGTSDHARWRDYELWITPSNRDDSFALRINRNMINGVAHEWGFEFDSIEDVREAAWEFVVAREKHMVGFYRKYGSVLTSRSSSRFKVTAELPVFYPEGAQIGPRSGFVNGSDSPSATILK